MRQAPTISRILTSTLMGVLFVFAAGIVFPSVASAQGRTKYAKPTRKQIRLNQKALEAHNAGKHLKAAEIFEKAVEIAEINVFYLNMGRAYQKAGLCKEANGAFGKALVSPKVKVPDADVVRQKVEEYRNELRSVCSGTVKIICSFAEPVTVGGVDTSCGQELTMLPGNYDVKVDFGGKLVRKNAIVFGLETTEIALEVPRGARDPVGGGETPPPPTGGGTQVYTYVGWGLVGVSGVFAVTGVIFGLRVEESNEAVAEAGMRALESPVDPNTADSLIEDARSNQLWQFIGYGAAAVTGAVGIIMILGSGGSETPQDVEASALRPVWFDGGAGVQWEGSF